MFEKKGANRSKEVEPEAPLSKETRAFREKKASRSKATKAFERGGNWAIRSKAKKASESSEETAGEGRESLKNRSTPLQRDWGIREKGANRSEETKAFGRKEQTTQGL